ncbi:extracellular solute-binding protein [Kineothrix sp. MSJ-39]|uniref:ABC transporter substrate-binding protein n=1 Tax=Kineothrix sp. MSJ-39 TaxID=2841533 RepID=UPI001C1085A6|nr:extracellular solute-binding protein [Kineothrix sp. MSJ-39]MBU5430085.1 extracellular solute-binding protein [Kineothrix sp. MSJ-39]
MKKRQSQIAYMLLCILLPVLLLTGCGQKQPEEMAQADETVEIPMILTVSPSSGKKSEQDVVDAFNTAYQGKYHIAVEWIMETEEEYRQNLKRLNVTDKLPAVITDLRMLPSYYRLMIEDHRIVDLAPYIEADPEWKQMIEPVVLDGCSEPDGSVYLSPISTAAFSCSGIFWNEELFAQAGIEEFPQTWEEFWSCCEKLQAKAITPLGLHTEGTGWSAMLLATAEMADSEEGAAFMNELYPSSYQNDCIYHMADTLQRLYKYTTKDAMNADFDVAYNNFVAGKVAMVANGYWMIDQLPEEFREKVRFSPFPGNKLVSSPETFGWAVVDSYSEEVKQGAIEFLKFRTAENQKLKEELFARDTDASRLLQDYIRAYRGQPQIVPNYQVKWNSVLQERTLGEALPALAQKKITQADFVRMLGESVTESKKEE